KRRSVPVSRDSEQNTPGSIRPNDVLLRRKSVMDSRHILDVNRGSIDGLDRQFVELVDDERAAVQFDGILGSREFGCPRRQNQILQAQRIRYVNWRKLFRVQLVEIQIHNDLAVLSPERIGNVRALNRREGRADEVIPEVENLLLA